MSGINDVVNAVVQYVVNPAIGPNTAFGSKVLNYEPQISGVTYPPIAWVYTTDTTETRSGYGGINGGKKWVDHAVHIEITMTTHNPDTDEINFRTLTDAVRAKMRTNQSLGGLVQRYGEEIDVALDRPVADGAVVRYHVILTSTAREEITVIPS